MSGRLFGVFLIASAIACGVIPVNEQHVFAQSTKALLLFGGEDHKTFLGCLNCVETSASSVCNSVGSYGSSVASDSIWNDVGRFGSDVSTYSPWNVVAQDAPIIVDKDGHSYGYFSANEVHHDRTHIGWLVAVLDFFAETSDHEKTHRMMCGE